jgi:hypothetical protein
MSDETESNDEDALVAPTEDVAAAPSETADPPGIVVRKIPADIFARYDVYSYRNAAVILAEARRNSTRSWIRCDDSASRLT